MARATVCGSSWLSSTLTWLCCPSCQAVFSSSAMRACWRCGLFQLALLLVESGQFRLAAGHVPAVGRHVALQLAQFLLGLAQLLLQRFLWAFLAGDLLVDGLDVRCRRCRRARVSCSEAWSVRPGRGRPRSARRPAGRWPTGGSRGAAAARGLRWQPGQAGPGHFLRLRQGHQGQQGRRDVRNQPPLAVSCGGARPMYTSGTSSVVCWV